MIFHFRILFIYLASIGWSLCGQIEGFLYLKNNMVKNRRREVRTNRGDNFFGLMSIWL